MPSMLQRPTTSHIVLWMMYFLLLAALPLAQRTPIPVPSTPSGCPIGTFLDATINICRECEDCPQYPESKAVCESVCFCNGTADCVSSSSFKDGFCANFTSTQRTTKETTTQQVCRRCHRVCKHTSDSNNTHPVGDSPHPYAPDCGSSCNCSSHSECPTGFYCGKNSWLSTNHTFCRYCYDCTPDLAVDGVCPLSNCYSPTFQCLRNEDCPEQRAWCNQGHTCNSCTMKGDCYILEDEVSNKGVDIHSDRFPVLSSMCAKDCCGWNTFPTKRVEDWHGTIRFIYGLCQSEEYSDFESYYLTKRDFMKDKHDGVLADLESGAIFGNSAKTAVAVGAKPCKVRVLNSTTRYPRIVPDIQCLDLVSRCHEDHVGIVAFAKRNGNPVRLGAGYIDVFGDYHTCPNHDSIFSWTNFSGENYGLILLVVFGSLVGCGIFTLAAYLFIIRPRLRRKRRHAEMSGDDGAATSGGQTPSIDTTTSAMSHDTNPPPLPHVGGTTTAAADVIDADFELVPIPPTVADINHSDNNHHNSNSHHEPHHTHDECGGVG